MTRTTAVLAAAMMVVGMVGAVPAAGAAVPGSAEDANAVGDDVAYAQGNGTGTNANETETNETETNETDDGTDDNDAADAAGGSVAPGERFSGVVGVQGAEIEGEVESRTFGLRVAKAATAGARAAVVAESLNRTEERLQELEKERERLEAQRENGTISEGKYAARTAVIEAKLNSTERQLDETEGATEGLPEDVLEANGVNASAIGTLRDRASDVSGPETAAVARTIAGPNVGASPSAGPPENVSAPGRDAETASDRPAAPGTGGENPPASGQRKAGPTNETAAGERGGAADHQRGGPDERPGGPNADERGGPPGDG